MLIFALILFTLAILPRVALRMAGAARGGSVPRSVSGSPRSSRQSAPTSHVRSQRFAFAPGPVSRQPKPGRFSACDSLKIPGQRNCFQGGALLASALSQRFSAFQPLSAGATYARDLVISGCFQLAERPNAGGLMSAGRWIAGRHVLVDPKKPNLFPNSAERRRIPTERQYGTASNPASLKILLTFAATDNCTHSEYSHEAQKRRLGNRSEIKYEVVG